MTELTVDSIKGLEEKVLKSDTANRSDNLALLKLYKFFPSHANLEVVGVVLAQAMTLLPSNDFSLCMYLLPDALLKEEPVITLFDLAHFLETGRFVEFWERAQPLRQSVLGKVPGFEQAVRRYMASLVAQTYRTISIERVAEYMDLAVGSEALAELLAALGWTAHDQVLTTTPDATPAPSAVTDKRKPVNFNQLAELLKAF